jgi:hypothetical protein
MNIIMLKDIINKPKKDSLREKNKKANLNQFAKDKYNIDNRLILAISHFSEQQIKQVRRNFYHISPKKVDKLKVNNIYAKMQHKYGTIFLSNSVKFCQDFYKIALSNFGSKAYLYTCKLKNYMLNLFNVDYQKDWFRCEKFISNNNRKEFESLFNKLYNNKYKDRWLDIEQSILPDLAYETGFDGYSNFGFIPIENFRGANNMALFNENDIEIIDIKEIDVYKNYKEEKFKLLKEK